jgi:hypothetical protein
VAYANAVSIVAFVVLALTLLANAAVTIFPGLGAKQPLVNLVAPLIAIAAVFGRNYLNNQRAYELFSEERLEERRQLAVLFADHGPVLQSLAAGVILFSGLGCILRFARERRVRLVLGASAWLMILAGWIALSRVHWTRML